MKTARISAESINSDAIGKKAAILSTVEIGLGSVIHGFRIPLGGHALSLNQGFMLTHASIQLKDRRAAPMISTTAALLKSLSPAGARLSPMLAISIQGQLYALGMVLLGNNFVGQGLGMLLLSVWGFLQPLSFYLLVYGGALVAMARFYLKELNKLFPVSEASVLHFLLVLVVIKIMVGWILVVLAHRMKTETVDHFEKWAQAQKISSEPVNFATSIRTGVFQGAFKDLLHPLFVISWALMTLFLVYADSSQSQTVWILLRPLALGYLIFLLLRIFPLEKVVKRMEGSNPVLAKNLESALRYLRGRDKSDL